jgi:hypothetical protein
MLLFRRLSPRFRCACLRLNKGSCGPATGQRQCEAENEEAHRSEQIDSDLAVCVGLKVG